MDNIRTPEPEGDIHESLGRVLGALKRRRWWILLPACIISSATVAVSLWLPNHFTSEAKILVLEQQISQSVVGAFSTTSVAEQLQGITQEVLSRARLVGIADQFALYSQHRGELTDERIGELMRKAIDVQPADAAPGRNTFSAFTISFSANTPELAQQVTRTLASLFIESNSKTQQSRATNTVDLLEDQVNVKRRQLAELEQRRRNIEAQQLEAIPEQQGNQTDDGLKPKLPELRIQLENTTGNLSRARQQRLYMESVLSSSLSANRAKLQSERSANLVRLKAERSALLARFTPRHPEVVKKDQEIATEEALLNAQKSGEPGKDETEITADDPALRQLRAQLTENSQEIMDLSKNEDRLKASIAQEESRLTASVVASHNPRAQAPVRQLADVDREFGILTQEIVELEMKRQQSGLVADMEQREQGRRFRQLDPASLPTAPSSPNRLKINLGGAGGGIALGLALAFLMDIRARSFYTEKQLSQCFGVPITIGVPMLFTPGEKRSLKWRLAFEWVGGSVLMAATIMVEYYVYRQG